MGRRACRAPLSALCLAGLLLVPRVGFARPVCTRVLISASPNRTALAGGTYFRGGGPGLAYVIASAPDCTWTVSSDASWLTLPDGATGTGSGWLRYTVAAWSSTSSVPFRSATITVTATSGALSFGVGQSSLRSPDGNGWMQSPAGWTASPSTASVAQPFKISGFAIDDRATSGTGVSSVDLFWVDNTGTHPLGTATYGLNHTHLADTLGSQFANGGYEMLVSGVPAGTTVPAGAGVSIQAFSHSTVDGSTSGVGATRVRVIDPSLSVSPSTLAFGAVSTSGAVSAVTPAQTLTLAGFGWTSSWTASTSQPWIQLSATSGTGPGRLDVSIVPAQIPASGVLQGTIHIDAAGVPGAPIDIPVRVDAYLASVTGAPFGSFDTAPSPSSGAVPLNGWALDDVGVANVAIYRGRSQLESGSSLVFIGNATFVDGARPDVAAAYPGTPQNTRAGWGYMLLSNVLPGGGNETLTFYAYAVDAEGKQTLLGARPVTLDNTTGDLPFGALDTPAPGAAVSGDYTFAGWVVSPRPRQIVRVQLYLDGQYIGSAQYGTARPDVAALFGGPSGPPDASAPGFKFTIDTRGFANGLHTFALVAADNTGTFAGLASRFFIVKNP